MDKKALALLGFGHAVTDIIQGALSMTLAFLQPVLFLSQFQVGLVMLAFGTAWICWGRPSKSGTAPEAFAECT